VKCQVHSSIDATRSCHACLQALCDDCTQEVLGAFYCTGCLAERLQPQAQAPPPRLPKRKRIKVPFVSGLLSFLIPGLGQVYNGLLGRALFHFIGFLLIGWSIDQVGGAEAAEVMMAFVFMGYYGWQVVDAVRTAKDINSLGRVPNSEEAEAMGRGSIPGLNRGSKGFGIGMMVVGGLILLSNLGMSRVLSHFIEGLWPVALLVGGIWLVRRSREERRVARPGLFDEIDDLDEEYELAAEGMER